MKKIESCEICESKHFILVEPFGQVNTNIYKCANCGIYFQNPMPTKQSLSRLYDQIYSKRCNLPLAEQAFENVNEDQEKLRLNEVEKFVKRGKLLDVGASTGFFISFVNRKPEWDAVGIEYSKKAVEKAKRDFGIDLIRGEITKSNFPDSSFDVITMHSVLDHVPDLQKTVKTVHKKLKKGGYFIFNVASVNSFEYSFYKFLHKSFPGFIFEHLYYFNPYAMSLLMQKNGFFIKKMTSRHYSLLRLPPIRPLMGIVTFIPKLFLEYTDLGGKLNKGNIVYVYANKI